MVSAEGFVGRDSELTAALEAIAKGHSVVVKGRTGIGKSALLEAVAKQVEADGELTVVRLEPIAAKQAMLSAAEQLHKAVGLVMSAKSLPPKVATRARMGQPLTWEDIRRSVGREPVADTVAHLKRTMRRHPCLLVVDSLELPPSYATVLDDLAQCAVLIGAMDVSNRRNKIVKLLWRFQCTVELKPLGLDESEQLISQSSKRHALRFADDRTRRLFLRHVAHQGGGVPAAMVAMLDEASAEDRITPAKVRGFSHEAGVQYMDMTPALILVLVGFMALRYIGRGIGEVELVVLSGVSTALLMGIRYFIFAMRR